MMRGLERGGRATTGEDGDSGSEAARVAMAAKVASCGAEKLWRLWRVCSAKGARGCCLGATKATEVARRRGVMDGHGCGMYGSDDCDAAMGTSWRRGGQSLIPWIGILTHFDANYGI